MAGSILLARKRVRERQCVRHHGGRRLRGPLRSLYGSGVKRDGSPDATLSKAGITAQKMQYLDVLFGLAPRDRVPRVRAPEGEGFSDRAQRNLTQRGESRLCSGALLATWRVFSTAAIEGVTGNKCLW
jgi:hypothetical protein